jgi:hypothetical protein
MRYRLSALVILVAVGPPILAGVWQFEADSWPLFLAVGVAAWFVFVVIVGFVIAWLLETAARVMASVIRARSERIPVSETQRKKVSHPGRDL